MKYSYNWLKEIVPIERPPEELSKRLLWLGFEVSAIEKNNSDFVLDIEIPANRPDLLSHIGMAREMALFFELPFTPPPECGGAGFDSGPGDTLPITIEDPRGCPRYHGMSFHGLKIGPSPEWMAEKLSALGVRPINSLVDITNYILLETGQPMHAFDQERLSGREIRVRRARPGEKILALDGNEYELKEEDLIIADSSRPVAIAGIIGGEETSVRETTKSAFLECAYFNPPGIRRTAGRLGIRTESSYRFERGTDTGAPAWMSRRAAHLIRRLCGPEISVSNTRDIHPAPIRQGPVSVTTARLEELLGMPVPRDKAGKILKGIDPGAAADGGSFTVTPPSYRQDLRLPADLAEEVGRFIGYGNIPTAPSAVPFSAPKTLPHEKWLGILKSRLISMGFCEAYNYDFVSQKDIFNCLWDKSFLSGLARLDNPISNDWVYLRPSLIPGLLKNLRHNLNRGAETVLLFESGIAYGEKESVSLAVLMTGTLPSRTFWKGETSIIDFFHVKGALKTLLEGLHDFTLETSPAGAAPRNSASLRASSRTPGASNVPELREGAGAPGAGASPRASGASSVPSLRLGAGFGRNSVSDGNIPGYYHPKVSSLITVLTENRTVPFSGLGYTGAIHPLALEKWEIKATEVFCFELNIGRLPSPPSWTKRFSRYSQLPSSQRDISTIVPQDTRWESLSRLARETAGGDLVSLELVDVFTGKGIPEGKKSLTIRLTWNSSVRTLSDQEVEKALKNVVTALSKEFGAELRK